MKQFLKAVAGILLFGAIPAYSTCTVPFCSMTEPTTTITQAIPNSPPYNSLSNQDMRWEFRLHGSSLLTNSNFFWAVGNFNAQITASSFYVTTFYDTVFNNGVFIPVSSLSSTQDYLVRVTRDATNMNMRLEMCPIQAQSSCIISSSTINALASNPSFSFPALGEAFGNTTTAGSLAFFRWFNSTVPFGTQIPLDAPNCSGSNCLVDYEFNNNLNDVSGNSLNMTGSPTYINTPDYNPFCSAGITTTYRIGDVSNLSGAASKSLSEGFSISTYAWTQLTSEPIVLSGTTTISPSFTSNSVTDKVASVNFQLVVVDSANLTSTCTIHDGLIASDKNHVISDYGNTALNKILLPQIQMGYNLWPWYDTVNQAWAIAVGSNVLNSPLYVDDWNTALPGTVTVTVGTTTVTGVGTSFRNEFCAGSLSSSTWDTVNYFILWSSNTAGGIGRQLYALGDNSGNNACLSDTQLNLHAVYSAADIPGAGLNFSKMGNPGQWIGPSDNNNYYDNVLAFYSIYYRSGIDTYLNFARTLVAKWWSVPYLNFGYEDCNVDACVAPRIQAITGVVVAALDNHPEWWPGIENMQAGNNALSNAKWIDDSREQAFLLSQQALCAIADPTPTNGEACESRVAFSVQNVWTPHQLPDGSFPNSQDVNTFYVRSTWNGGLSGTVTLTQSTDVIVGVGTGWTNDANTFPTACTAASLGQDSCYIWFSSSTVSPITSPPLTNVNGDTQTYLATFIDSTHIRIDRPYTGSYSGPGHGYQIGIADGWGDQPFMMGVVAAAMDYSSKAMVASSPTVAATAQQLSVGAANWILSTGTINNYMGVDYDGLFYARNYVDCETIYGGTPYNLNCAQQLLGTVADIQGIRYLNQEIFHGIAGAFQYSNNDPNLKNMINFAYGRTYGGLGGPYADANYINTEIGIDGSGFFYNKQDPKTFGFFSGWGLGAVWPAILAESPSSSGLSFSGTMTLKGTQTIQ